MCEELQVSLECNDCSNPSSSSCVFASAFTGVSRFPGAVLPETETKHDRRSNGFTDAPSPSAADGVLPDADAAFAR